MFIRASNCTDSSPLRSPSEGLTIRGTITHHPPRRSRTLLRARRYPTVARPAAGTLLARLRRLRQLLPLGIVAFVAFGGLSAPVAREAGSGPVEARAGALPATAEATIRASGPIAGITGAPNLREASGGSTDGPAGEPSDVPGETEAGEESGSQAQTQEGPIPVFVQYVVRPGDTVSEIAAQFGISTNYVVWNNVNVIDDADSLAIGATLQIPGIEGIIHSARVGDTVSHLAVAYDSTTEAIVNFEANGFAGDANNLQVGALILLPGGRPIPPEPVVDSPGGASGTPPPLSTGASWVWPATGRLTNVFSARHPLGIDISMVVNTGIAAASAGQVTFVGGNPCCSYGYHVIIQHPDGIETLYAHLSSVYVSNGQWVNTGDLIAASGNTGYSTGPHLHFEVRKNGVYTNPLGWLP